MVWSKTAKFAATVLLISRALCVDAQSVGVSNIAITPDASSIMELRSTTKGFLPPRVTAGQRDSIVAPAVGLMVFNTTANQLNFFNGTIWTSAIDSYAVVSEPYSSINVNTSGVGVLKDGSGHNFQFKGVDAGSAKLSVANDATNNTIDIDVNESSLSLNNIGGTLQTDKGGTGNTSYSNGQLLIGNASGSLSKAALTAGNGINITNGSGSVTIATEGYTAGNVNTTGVGVLKDGSGHNFQFKGVNAGSGKLSVVNNATANTVDIDVNESSLLLNNFGGTLQTDKGGTGNTSYSNGQLLIGNASGSLSKAALTAGNGINITNGSGSVTIATEGYTAANVNTTGVGVLKDGSGHNFQFKGVNAGSGKLSVVNNATANTVDIDVNESSLLLNNIGGTLQPNKGGTGNTTYSNGQLLIGNASGSLSKASLTAGNGINITNGSGAVTIANNIAVTEVNDTSYVSTSSASYTSIGSGLGVTPGAGDYIVFFSGNVENPTKDESTYFSIFSNGSQIAQSQRFVTGHVKGGENFSASTMAYITNLGAGQTIEVKWKVTASNAGMHQRQLIVQRVK